MTADRGKPERPRPDTPGGRTADAPQNRTPHQSGNPEFVGLVNGDPQVVLQSGQVLFAEGDPPTCMYIVKTGNLQIRSGSVIYENVGPGGIVGEMCLVEKHQTRSATVYALTDCELVEIDEARFASLVVQEPSFAIAVMQALSRRLRVMDRRYRPGH